MSLIPVNDESDSCLALYRGVSDPVLLREHGMFVAEGRLVVRRLLTTLPLETVSVLVTEPALQSIEGALDARPGLPVYVAAQSTMNRIAGFNIHRGCLALGRRPPSRDAHDVIAVAAASVRLIVLEGVSNADNVGGIFRSAAALGGGPILLGPGCADPLYRKAIRTSIGATLEIPFADARPWPGTLNALRARGFRVLALTPATHAQTLAATVREHGALRRIAIVAGAEGDGLSAAALSAADALVRIPMASSADSLNVMVAVSIALHRLGSGL